MHFKKRNLTLVIIVFLLVILTIPLTINFVANNRITESPAEFSAWLGFWGSYIGGLLSGIITLGGVYIAFRLDRKEKLRQAVYRNYKIMLRMSSLLSEMFHNVEEKKGDLEWLGEKKKVYDELMGKMIEDVNGEWAEDIIEIYLAFDKIDKDSDQKKVNAVKHKISILDSKIGVYMEFRLKKKRPKKV